MLIDDLLKKIDIKDSNKGYYTFETFILNLLKVHLEKSNKLFITQPRRMSFDAYAPDGIENIIGPTQIEIKFNIERLPPRFLIDQILRIQSRVPDIEPFTNILLITAHPVSAKYKEQFESRFHNLILPYKVFLWGSEEINRIVSKNKKRS